MTKFFYRYLNRHCDKQVEAKIVSIMGDVSNVLIEDFFEILDIDRDGKKFDRGEQLLRRCNSIVSRIFAKSENYEMDMTLDVNTELYPLHKQEKITILLARSLSLDGTVQEEVAFDSSRHMSRTLADDFDYVMFGKIYKVEESVSGKM